jgi:hypothetical protein
MKGDKAKGIVVVADKPAVTKTSFLGSSTICLDRTAPNIVLRGQPWVWL